jgi:hypothetical protein
MDNIQSLSTARMELVQLKKDEKTAHGVGHGHPTETVAPAGVKKPQWLQQFFATTTKDIKIKHEGKPYAIRTQCGANFAEVMLGDGRSTVFARRSNGDYLETRTGLLGAGKTKPKQKQQVPTSSTSGTTAPPKSKLSSSSTAGSSSAGSSASMIHSPEPGDHSVPACSPGYIAGLLNDWNIDDKYRKHIVKACSEQIPSDTDFFKMIFEPHNTFKDLHHSYEKILTEIVMMAIGANYEMTLLVAYFPKHAELKADLQVPDLREKAQAVMDVIRKNALTMSIQFTLLGKKTETMRDDFRKLVMQHPKATNSGKLQQLKQHQGILVEDINEFRSTHKKDVKSHFTSLGSQLQQIANIYMELQALRTQIVSQPSDIDSDFCVDPAFYEKFDPQTQHALTAPLLQVVDQINELRASIRTLRSLQETHASLGVPKQLASMAADISSSLKKDLDAMLARHADATEVVNTAIQNFLAYIDLEKQSTTEADVGTRIQESNAKHLVHEPTKQVTAALKECRASHETNSARLEELARTIKSGKDYEQRTADYYQENFGNILDDRASNFNALKDRAQPLGIEVDESIEALFEKTRNCVATQDWDNAIINAAKAKSYVGKLEKKVILVENAKTKFDAISHATSSTLRPIIQACNDWKLKDARTEIDKLVAEATSAKESGNWPKAARLLAKLDERSAELTSLTAAFVKFKADALKPMLHQGRIAEIYRRLVDNKMYSDEMFLNELDGAYERQCRVPRETWLKQLDISGHNIIEFDQALKGSHMTVFNDAVSKSFDAIDVRGDTNEIMSTLFGVSDAGKRVHVTKVVQHGSNEVRGHRYFDDEENYSANLDYLPDELRSSVKNDLDKAYDEMVSRLAARIDELRENHGRTSA